MNHTVCSHFLACLPFTYIFDFPPPPIFFFFSFYFMNLSVGHILEWAFSSFVTKSGHADNPETYAPCVKSMTADFISQNHRCAKFTKFPTGGLPYNFVRRICFTLKIFHEKYRIIARGESCEFSVWFWNHYWTSSFQVAVIIIRNWMCGIGSCVRAHARSQWTCM